MVRWCEVAQSNHLIRYLIVSAVQNVWLAPPTQPGAPQDSAASLMPGLRAFACAISHHSYPRSQFRSVALCMWLGSAPSVELVSPPISTLRICRAAPYPGLNR